MTVVIAGMQHTQGAHPWFASTHMLLAILEPLLALVIQRYVVWALTFGPVKV
ncbi:MAG: hypothetical protein IMX02_06840 [Limnochordaceae bacterium]|nr:hypothetical protein [Limnochordaceae bacterium]